ncbi:MAG TPA: SDR family NAD(P)-dependent oxidoreductase [Candidatus Limnocylindrales bacterium]|nr:SDR family NAD(P)-dependent oxidoreductase [Candidatus Limnocylindrales bacterium]
MAGEFAGRVALVTGGAGAGIGSHTVRRLAAEGAAVAVVDIHERRCHAVAEEIASELGASVRPYPGDIADRERMQEVVAQVHEQLGPIDVLVNNAAENVLAPIREFSMQDWDRVLDVDLTAAFHLIRLLLPGMIERRRGSIVNVASIAGWLGDANEGREAPYASAKSAMFSLTRSVAFEGGPYGVRCNAVAPGLIWSKFVARYADQFQKEIDRTPLRRFGQPQEVAELIAFLASDRSAFITGEAVNISGGWYMRP